MGFSYCLTWTAHFGVWSCGYSHQGRPVSGFEPVHNS